MTALSERNIEVVRTLVASAPEKVLGSLKGALADTPDETALGAVRRLVEGELAERALRNSVLSPIVPMCVGAGEDAKILTFPSRVPALLWRGLDATVPEPMAEARAAAQSHMPPGIVVSLHDSLLLAAAAGLRARSHPDFAAVAELCDKGRAGGADMLASCLEIGPIVRAAALRLPEWLAHQGGDTTAAARLAFKDATAVSEDLGPRFFQMLSAQMDPPWMVLRVISAVMDKPPEHYLAASELAWFGENLMADIDAALNAIAALDPEAGPEAGLAAADTVELVVQQIVELEGSIELTRDHGWGARVHMQRGSLAGVVERRLKEAERATVEALPTQASRQQGRRRPVPKLAEPPSQRLVTRALTLLSFSHGLRKTANYGGFGSARARLVEALGEHIDHYVEDVLDLIRTDDVPDRDIAEAYLEAAASFNDLVLGEKAAELIRRRTTAALHPEQVPPPPAPEPPKRAAIAR